MENTNGSKLFGILFAFIGGLIGSIPWVLVYVFLERIQALLVILVGICAFYGYILGNKDITFKGAIIVVLVALVAATLVSFGVIPAILILKETHSLSIEAFKAVYSYKPFVDAMKIDYLKSMLFMAIGVFGFLKACKEEA